MGFIDTRQDITASIKEQTDIVRIIGEHVELKRSGVRFLGLCPFHGEKTPSFSVHADQQFYHCFGCGESGDVFSFMMKYHNLDFKAALQQLADRLNITLPQKHSSEEERKKEELRKRLFAVSLKAAGIYRKYLQSDKGAEGARKYLVERGIPENIQERFFIGYAPAKEIAGWEFLARQLTAEDAVAAEEVGLLVANERGGRYDRFRDRVLFPIFDERGRICGFGGRIVGEGQPKYMNSPESHIYNKSRLLLGLYQQGTEIRKKNQAVIVEGNFDMISLVVHGCSNVVAPLGTALTASQIRLLKRYAEEAVVLFDGDEAGVKAAQRCGPLFLTEQMYAKVAVLPEKHDPDTFIRAQGVAKLTEMIKNAEELPEFILRQLVQQHGLSLEGKTKIAEEMKPLIAATVTPLQRSVIIAHFSKILGVSEDQLTVAVLGENLSPAKDFVLAKKPRPQERGKTTPLSSAQKRLVEFMLLNPRHFSELEKRGIRDVLEGSLGEILFLQMQMMLQNNNEIDPEEVLSDLPDGPERSLVTEMLLGASAAQNFGEAEEEQKNIELSELTEWLELENMRRISGDVSLKIEEAGRSGDFAALEKLLQEKQNIEKEMRKSRN